MDLQRTGAVVLAGGGAARLGGAGKAGLEVGAMTLLERTLDALIDIAEVVVVGEPVPTSRPVSFTREHPPGGGPAAGLLTGLAAFLRPPAWVVALAVDMPYVNAATLRRLTDAAQGSADGAVLVDGEGRRQHLCAVYSVAGLERLRPPYEEEYGLAMHRLVADLDLEAVPAIGYEARDIDSWDDVRAAREHFTSG